MRERAFSPQRFPLSEPKDVFIELSYPARLSLYIYLPSFGGMLPVTESWGNAHHGEQLTEEIFRRTV